MYSESVIINENIPPIKYNVLHIYFNFCYFKKCKIICLFYLTKVVREGSANLSKEFIEMLLRNNSHLRDLRYLESVKLHNSHVALYQSLLSMKNVSLVLIVYRYLNLCVHLSILLIVSPIKYSI